MSPQIKAKSLIFNGHAEAAGLGFTGNAKLYPLGFAPDAIPQFIQPYLTFGMGLGRFETYVPRSFGATGETDFLARFGGGVDFLLSQHWGVYIDGAYSVTNKDVFSGFGSMQFGGLYRF